VKGKINTSEPNKKTPLTRALFFIGGLNGLKLPSFTFTGFTEEVGI
jgi:hypothetical protein